MAKLTADDGAEYDHFGRSVAISGDMVVVGAYQDDDDEIDSGAAYLFARNAGGTDQWGQVTKFTADDGEANDEFGWSGAIAGDVAIEGAHNDNDQVTNSGAAYVFALDAARSDQWGEVTKITDEDGAFADRYGISVAIDGELFLVEAPADDDNGSNPCSVHFYNSSSCSLEPTF